PEIDALFEGLDDMDDGFQELAPPLDLDALRREADARNVRAVRAEIAAMIPTAELSAAARAKATAGKGKAGPLDGVDGAGEDDGKKRRKPVPKLDEARLLGKNGLPQLVKDTKNFKPMGKGHEATDLDRVLQLYHFWAHRLYPKTRFKETVDRVEKLCHSKRMQVALGVWRDEARGLVNGVRLPPENNDNDSDADSDLDLDAPRLRTRHSPSSARSPPRRRIGSGHLSVTGDSEGDDDGLHVASDASHPPPSSPSQDEAAAIELDRLLEEVASHASAPVAPSGHAWKPSNGDDAVAMDEDEDLWVALDASAPASAPTTTASVLPTADDDEDMWDIVHEFEQEGAKKAAHQLDPVQDPPAPAAVEPEVDDLDDLYL
ncbi:replication fork protection component Swi3-domain-containing protein, partial [Russula earlei]